MKSYILILLILFSFSSLAQEKIKDTLYIKYDINILSRKQDTIEKKFIHLIKGTGNNGFVYLLEVEILNNLNPKKVNYINNILNKNEFSFKSKYLNKDKRGKINDWKLAEYFDKHMIFLVSGKNYIKVTTKFEID